ncbi:MAG: DinB family protein [Bacteroidia bacterium]|nr:DinB family protein [Bacteroidia bacterium]
MHPQLQRIDHELLDASHALQTLRDTIPAEQWRVRVHSGRWSIAECVAHLNLTSEAFLPLLNVALESARNLAQAPPPRYRMDVMGWLLWRMLPPPVRIRTRTTAAFIPQSLAEVSELVSAFDNLQLQLHGIVRDAEGLPLQQVRVRSPFNEKTTYNLFSALSILPRHQLRHLWQAQQIFPDAME